MHSFERLPQETPGARESREAAGARPGWRRPRPGSVAQLSSVLHVPDIQLNDATLAQIDGIFPAVGESPEAYAW